MHLTDGKTTSIWPVKADVPSFPPLSADQDTDVCVIGSGIAGLSAAYLLTRERREVIVVSERQPGDGQTGGTSAHLVSAIDDRFADLYKAHGEQVTKLAYQSHAAAIDRIEAIARAEKIECDFARVNGFLFLNPDDTETTIQREFDAAKLIGVADVEHLPRPPIKTLGKGSCLRFGRQGIFHPLNYLAGLARCIEGSSGRIFCGNRAIDVQGSDSQHTKCLVTLDNGCKVKCNAVVVATNTPAPIQNWAGIYTKQIPYRTYVIGARIPRGSVASALYWDTGFPYHYLRIDSSTDPDHDILLVGGEDHKVGVLPEGAAPFLRLEQWARERFEMIIDIPHRWSGQTQEPSDGLAYIGRAPIEKGNVFVATGDSGQGLTHGTIAGILLTDLIVHRENPWAEVYDPSRKPVHGIGEFLAHNLDAMKTFKDYLTPGEVESADEIPAGSGALIRQGLKKIAIYRDPGGALHELSPVCTHLGCIVQWNHVEKSWDCPCHGSRFDTEGRVLMGPATDDLSKTSRS